MKKIISLLLICAMGLQMVGCGANMVQASDLMAGVEPGIVEPVELNEEFLDGQMNFAVELFQDVFAESNGQNVLLSPTSAQMALAMTANGADNTTRKEMENVLADGMSIEDLNVYLYSYLLELKNDDNLKIANSIWFREEENRLTVKEDFLQTNADYYGAEIYKAAFNSETAKDMNLWVKEHTDGMIDKIIEEIPYDAVMYLLNALAFEAEWEYEYEKTDIFDGTFTTADGKKETVEMMNSMESIYFEGEDVVGFKKNYKGQKYGFVALLPDEDVDILNYVQSLDGEELMDMLNTPMSKAVEVNMPKFSYSYETLLNDALKNMGMESAFDSRADLSKIGSSTNGPLSISTVLQKTFIEVDELGTKAGAATSVEITDECAPIVDLQINLNRPFLYMIVDNETNLPLFIGVLMSTEN